MYTIDHLDQVSELDEFPRASIGAPLPAVLATDGQLALAYLVEAIDPTWDGRTVRSVNSASADEIVALIEFDRPRAHLFGPPNDEAFSGHPLVARGLHPYGVFEVGASSWVRTLERMNRVHRQHNAAAFAELRHLIFAFHDSTFECVVRGYRIEVRGGSLALAVQELAGRVSRVG
jgi:hypothetical protein